MAVVMPAAGAGLVMDPAESVSRENNIMPFVCDVGPGDLVLISVPFAATRLQSEQIAAEIADAIGNGVRVLVLDCGQQYEVIAVFRPRHA